jgi:hypothetical protein
VAAIPDALGANDDNSTRCSVSSYSKSYVDVSAGRNRVGRRIYQQQSYTFESWHTSSAAQIVPGAMALLRSLRYTRSSAALWHCDYGPSGDTSPRLSRGAGNGTTGQGVGAVITSISQ